VSELITTSCRRLGEGCDAFEFPQFDAVMCSRFLVRSAFTWIKGRVKPEGYIMFCTFVERSTSSESSGDTSDSEISTLSTGTVENGVDGHVIGSEDFSVESSPDFVPFYLPWKDGTLVDLDTWISRKTRKSKKQRFNKNNDYVLKFGELRTVFSESEYEIIVDRIDTLKDGRLVHSFLARRSVS